MGSCDVLELVSVIMPAYNSADYIEDSILSVLNQTYIEFELIIVDNNSIDSTYKISQGYSRIDSRVHVYQCLKSGAAHARNFGLSKARGRYIAFLDSDDIWEKNKLHLQISFMKRQGSSISCTSYQPFSTSERSFKPRCVSDKISYKDLLKTCDVGCSTVIFDSNFYENSLFPLVPKEDYALWLNLTRNGQAISCLDAVLTFYRVYDGSISGNKILEAIRQWNIYRKHESLSFFKSVYYIFNYAYYGVKKRG